MTGGSPRGLPPRTYLPILVVTALAFLGIVGYFLKIGLSQTGTALGPVAQQGDANIRASAAPAGAAPDALPTSAPGEVVVPQSGGAPPDAAAGGPNG
ncbi:MAG: hypothetical protein IAI50_06025, partial [Candidatus Eremiobacteraeota bacterium]|nr:hypothetical protein [Candidatus Eremiobacteraeota bacterium]